MYISMYAKKKATDNRSAGILKTRLKEMNVGRFDAMLRHVDS
jgi:hypothetical protein